MAVINEITDADRSRRGRHAARRGSRAATNRTVVTFVGPPEPVSKPPSAPCASLPNSSTCASTTASTPASAGWTSARSCPCRHHDGRDGRICPRARQAPRRRSRHLGYCYEHAATTRGAPQSGGGPRRRVRGLPERLKATEPWKPDFGPGEFDAKYGATAVGARDFLVAYNVNLNTTSTRRANAIAFDVREKGRKKRAAIPHGPS
jgi:glutamate formiminotransferase/formiminotetrahydrofolate cyclodeaminase